MKEASQRKQPPLERFSSLHAVAQQRCQSVEVFKSHQSREFRRISDYKESFSFNNVHEAVKWMSDTASELSGIAKKSCFDGLVRFGRAVIVPY
jgi:hypothetical protein